jgi:hypothetical protein
MRVLRPSAIRTRVSGDAQYAQACPQPRYGLIVQRNGIRERPGTRFSTERARIS